MLQIAVCDPNARHRRTLSEALAKLLFDAGEYHFYFFSSGEELLAYRKGSLFFQLVFLEIHLPGCSGLETARRIREISSDIDLIFLTSAAEYALEGYRYHAFDFLIKPVSLARLQDVVERYLAERQNRPADFLNVSIQRSNIQIPLYQIYYLESSRRKVIAHTWEEPVEFYERLDHLEELLAGSGFLRCHQSYLINRDHIRRINKTSVVLSNNQELPISRSYLQRLHSVSIPDFPGNGG